MKKKYLILILLSSIALFCAADDDEMTSEVKPGSATKPKPAPPAKPPSPADFALRTKVRKNAPFWIEDSARGAAIRINKDGTFSSEAQGGGSIAGSWKALNNQLMLQWSDGGESYSYPLGGGKGALTIDGKKIKKNRYKMS